MRTILTSILLLSVITFCSAQASATVDDPTAGKTTTIKYDSTVINLGMVPQGTTVTKLITFKNTGKRELLFSACNAPSKNLVVSCPASNIRPGQSSNVKVTFTADKVGKFKQKIDLVTNAMDGTTTITLKGEVVATPIPVTESKPAVEVKPASENK